MYKFILESGTYLIFDIVNYEWNARASVTVVFPGVQRLWPCGCQ